MTAEAIAVAATGVASLLVFGVVQSFLWLGRRHHAAAMRPGEIDTSQYQLRPHIHVVDYDRSEIRVMENGMIVSRCCLYGCPAEVAIGRDVVDRMTEEWANHD